MTTNFIEHVRIKCVFCGKIVSAGFDQKGRGTVLHEMPECERFKVESPDEFMRSNRVAMAGGNQTLD